MEKIVIEQDPILFTEEEIKVLNLTQEELSILQAAMADADTVNKLPDSEKEEDKLFAKIEKKIPNTSDMKEGFEKIIEVSKKEPDFLEQILTLYTVVNSVEELPPPTAEKVSLEDIANEQATAIAEQIINTETK